jgi:hypothetical protein
MAWYEAPATANNSASRIIINADIRSRRLTPQCPQFGSFKSEQEKRKKHVNNFLHLPTFSQGTCNGMIKSPWAFSTFAASCALRANRVLGEHPLKLMLTLASVVPSGL